MTTASLSLAACSGDLSLPAGARSAGTATLVDLSQEVLFDGPLLAVPDTRWDRYPPAGEPGHWRFRTFARILCEVREPVDEALEIGFLPEAATAGFSFRISWDGREVDAARIRRDGEWRWIAVPASDLTPGRHELVLRRHHPPGTFHKARHDNLFDELRFVHGGGERVLTPADARGQRLVAQFLQHGVVGRGQERRGGLLALAAGSHRLALGSDVLSARFEPENFSARPATFRVAAGGRETSTTLDAGERGEILLELPEGTDELTVEVAGTDGSAGPFLWGMPALEAAGDSEPLPPIVLITLDTTRRDAVSPYSGRPEVTPVLAELARHATVFEQAYSTSPWTLPSHASIFTGLYPSKHGAGVRDVQLPAGTRTLAGLLRRRGYLTAGFSAGELSSSRFGLAQGFHLYRNPDQFETVGSRLADYVDAFLDRYSAYPLFLFINYFDPHAVFRAPAEFEDRLEVPALADEIRTLPVWKDLLDGEMGAWRQAVEGEAPITPEVRDYLRAAYLAEVAFVDHLLGRLFDRLRALGLYERALIVVTADHGELLGEDGYVSHGARLDAELVEIPLIVKWPGQEWPGQEWPGQDEARGAGGLVSLVDLFPTLLRAAGVEAPASDGRPLQGDPEDRKRPFLFLEEHEFLIHPLPSFMKVSSHLYGVQRPDFRHLVWPEDQACERRRHGAWQAEACTAERERVLESIRAALGEIDAEAARGEMSDEVRERLKALGYL